MRFILYSGYDCHRRIGCAQSATHSCSTLDHILMCWISQDHMVQYVRTSWCDVSTLVVYKQNLIIPLVQWIRENLSSLSAEFGLERHKFLHNKSSVTWLELTVLFMSFHTVSEKYKIVFLWFTEAWMIVFIHKKYVLFVGQPFVFYFHKVRLYYTEIKD